MGNRDLVLVYNPDPSGARLNLRDGRTVVWDKASPVRALPRRDAIDAVRLGAMSYAEPIATVLERTGLTEEQLLAVAPPFAVYTPKGGDPQQVVVLDDRGRWSIDAAVTTANALQQVQPGEGGVSADTEPREGGEGSVPAEGAILPAGNPEGATQPTDAPQGRRRGPRQ
jgi:hypothetical protein